jgi:hypothetical protein
MNGWAAMCNDKIIFNFTCCTVSVLVIAGLGLSYLVHRFRNGYPYQLHCLLTGTLYAWI